VDVGNDEQVVDEVCTTLLSILLFKALSIVIGAVNGPNSVIPRLLVDGCKVLVDLLNAAARSWT
jgi:hypothetical protein